MLVVFRKYAGSGCTRFQNPELCSYPLIFIISVQFSLSVQKITASVSVSGRKYVIEEVIRIFDPSGSKRGIACALAHDFIRHSLVGSFIIIINHTPLFCISLLTVPSALIVAEIPSAC